MRALSILIMYIETKEQSERFHRFPDTVINIDTKTHALFANTLHSLPWIMHRRRFFPGSGGIDELKCIANTFFHLIFIREELEIYCHENLGDLCLAFKFPDFPR